jgi:TetR/AcrR family transcriptional regulator, mexCD-oprJ operon repressor
VCTLSLDGCVPLIERGQRDGTFRSDVPATWHLSTLLALIHAASGELTARRMPEAEIQAALAMTVLGAVTRAERVKQPVPSIPLGGM